MQIPLYILGLLMRFGPQHGYQIRKIIGEELADFTGIKLSVIYYHLEKMEREGLLHGAREKTSGRPEKTRYSVTQEEERPSGASSGSCSASTTVPPLPPTDSSISPTPWTHHR